ncbi:LADA_0G01684g1_1 [Lachancea dasiensis]|uniref:LADA_0G01684g1_1 n=1 Tax=Lachancea dasiensis TaxID=1072105 RepID=A0A1G4JR83_9SACH|nr:LADA_0G01684g1_1 [Lachancea dasiensis]
MGDFRQTWHRLKAYSARYLCKRHFTEFPSAWHLFLLLYVIFLISSIESIDTASAHPVDSHSTTLNAAFATQNKLCSMDHVNGQGSYRHLVSTLTGVDLGAFGKSKRMYTGFKFHKVYYFESLFKRVRPSLQMSYCNRGKLRWQAFQHYSSDISWNKPLCVYTPKETIWAGDHKKHWKWFNLPKKTTPQKKLESGTSLKEMAHNDIDNFHCFKLARREKYAHRNVSLYLPNKWIGGLFYCRLNQTTKYSVLERLSDDLGTFDGDYYPLCSLDTAIPLEPLISDSYWRQWTEVKPGSKVPVLRRISRTNMKKILPYMHTPIGDANTGNFSIASMISTNITSEGPTSMWKSLMDWRPSTLPTNQRWFADIEPDELYIYNEDYRPSLSDHVGSAINKFEDVLNRAQFRGINTI